jgi:inorganic pyrophosphatase
MTEETLVELRVEMPGGQHGRYEHDFRVGGLRLAEVIYPTERYPADLCAVTDSLADEATPLGALLLGNISHPSGCVLWARPLGAIEIHHGNDSRHYLIAIADDDPHFAGMNSVEALSPERRLGLELFLRLDGVGPHAEVRWLGADAAPALIRAARQRFRLAQAEQHDTTPLEPVWKPSSSKGEARNGEAERHTLAEYAIYSLPYRFQKYVEEYLAPNERILHGVHRPAMKSALHRTLLARKRLEEGIFIVGDQQVMEVTELMPPDSAGIRYGFIARSGVPERLEAVDVSTLSHDVVGLVVTWRASGGSEKIIWEFPASWRGEVERSAEMLRGWLPHADDHRLRRATPPTPPEELPPLRDPAAHDPDDTKPLAARLETALAKAICPDETVLARCLFPDWLEGRSAASMLTVTNRRLLVVPDPEKARAVHLAQEIPVRAIASLEFCSTLVMAYLKVFVPQGSRATEYTLPFTKTLSAMRDCYLMLRRTMATSQI